MSARRGCWWLRAMVLLLALAWILPAWAIPDDREARAPRWATADLACAASAGRVPGCSNKVSAIAPASGGELLRGYLRRAAAAGAPTRNAGATGQAPAQGAHPAALPRAPAKADDLSPVVHALHEVTAAMGLDAGADVLLAFASRPVMETPDGERVEAAPRIAAGFPFDALLGWGASLSSAYRSAGARFDHVLFNAIDPPRLTAWNNVTPESVPERTAARPAIAGALTGPALESAYLLGKAGAAQGDAGAGPVKKKRTIIYMERGRTTVMTVQDPPPK